MSKTDEGISTSELAMWRCLIGMAHADHNVADEERDYLYILLKSRPLRPEQYATLEDDLADAKDIDNFIAQVNDPHHRTELLDFARMMAWQDGVLTPGERDMITKIDNAMRGRVDKQEFRNIFGDQRELRQIRNKALNAETPDTAYFFDNLVDGLADNGEDAQ